MADNKDGTNVNNKTADDSIKKDDDPEVLQCMVDAVVNDLKIFNWELDRETDPKRRITISKIIEKSSKLSLETAHKCKAVLKKQEEKNATTLLADLDQETDPQCRSTLLE